MPLPKRAARARSADTAVRRTKHIFAKSIPCRRQKSKSFFHNPRFFTARPAVFPTRSRIAPRRKGVRSVFAPFFPPASFPSSFPPAPASHRGEKAFVRFSHRFSRPRLSHRLFHPPPHRIAAKRRLLDFRAVFPACGFSIVLPTRPASHRGVKAFARFSHRFSRPRLSHRLSHPAFFSFFGKSLDKGEKTCYNDSADYQTTVCRTSRRSTQEVEEAPLLRV